MSDPAPSVLGVQHPFLGEVIACAGDVCHVPARDQERIRAKADPPVAAHVRSPCTGTRSIAGTVLPDEKVALLAPFSAHPMRPWANGGYSQFTHQESISKPSLARRTPPRGRCHRRSPPIGTLLVSGARLCMPELLPVAASCCPCWHPSITVRARAWTWPSIRMVVIVVARHSLHLRARSRHVRTCLGLVCGWLPEPCRPCVHRVGPRPSAERWNGSETRSLHDLESGSFSLP